MIAIDENFVVPDINEVGKSTFVNPLGDDGHPDPCIVYCESEKCYYGISTTGYPLWGNDSLTIHRADNFGDMFTKSESKVVYKSNDEDDTYGYLWAPELHYIKEKWYIYTSCQNGPEDRIKHIIVLEAKTDSPFDGFKLCGHINRDVYAIDPSVYVDTVNDKLYLCCSPVIDEIQAIAVQELKSPAEPVGEMVVIAKPELPWEFVQNPIVEGGYFIKSPNGRIFIVYSANGCWSDDYALGILEYKGGDFVSAESWEKYPNPIVVKSNGNFGPGHATFFNSPDKSELWICHHCLETSNPELKPMKRRCHCQRVFFDKTGFPHIGDLLPCDFHYPVPGF